MKKTLLLLAALPLLLGACKKESIPVHNAEIIRNCTGTYVRVDNKDYQVCNLEATDPFPEHAKVKVGFDRLSDCPAGRERIICLMAWPNEGWVQVTYIR